MYADKGKEVEKAIRDLQRELSSSKYNEESRNDPIIAQRNELISSDRNKRQSESGFKPVEPILEPWIIPPWERLQDAIAGLERDDPNYTFWLMFLNNRQDDLKKHLCLQYAIKKFPDLMWMTSNTIIDVEEALPMWLINKAVDEYARGTHNNQEGLMICLGLLKEMVSEQRIIVRACSH